MTKKIGFACKLVELSPNNEIIPVPYHNTSATTVTSLNKKSKYDAEKKLWELLEYNLQAIYNLVNHVSNLEPMRKMVRLGSDILPAYTHPNWKWFWRQTEVKQYCESQFQKIGNLARETDVRLSMHPSQFVCLASDNADIVLRSVEEFEYHVTVARWMGYGHSWHDHGFKINVHLSGRNGVEGFQYALTLLTPEARNLITVENDEMGHGLDDVLQLANDCAIVPDIHHHWVRTGEYIQPDDPRIQQCIHSWRGVRPVMHYSVSREDLLVGHDPNTLPDMEQLLKQGFNKQKLRAHSDYYWNTAANQWAQSFWSNFDCQCESKQKNLASAQLAKTFSCEASL